MKTKVLSLASVFLFGTVAVFAANKSEKFNVSGNCSMCEKRIEKAALSVKGVSKADWNKESKMIELVFDDSKTDVDQVKMAIAKAGHDTPGHKATDEAYNSLHNCCKYDRGNSAKTHEGHSH
ncbi:heavy-metal-associated domain-containing protein [Gaoshiqia sp. Z1-71]|uniref:heavy-metal-associated domain-containing protein n=1 Tax=Gaoshiqia hydrogeniformans TaxID=3290090 RepID=UPI003BF7C2F3